MIVYPIVQFTVYGLMTAILGYMCLTYITLPLHCCDDMSAKNQRVTAKTDREGFRSYGQRNQLYYGA